MVKNINKDSKENTFINLEEFIEYQMKDDLKSTIDVEEYNNILIKLNNKYPNEDNLVHWQDLLETQIGNDILQKLHEESINIDDFHL